MRLPRFLWVPFELGRPFGAPHEPDFQRRVLHDALALLDRRDGPVVLADFPDDAPTGNDDVPWACPVSFAPRTADEPQLVASVRAEIAQLSPWTELHEPPAPNSGLALAQMVDVLVDATNGAEPDIEQIRLITDDLRTWYLHAAAQQPGQATSHERNTWFWRQTAIARLLGHLATALVDHHNRLVRAFATRAIVPRDHWDLLVPDPAPEHPDD